VSRGGGGIATRPPGFSATPFPDRRQIGYSLPAMTQTILARPRGIARGIFWMVLACLAFAAMMTSVRYMEGRFDAIQLVFIRSLVGLAMVVPLVARSGLGALRTAQLPLHGLRTVLAFLAMATLYYALARTPVANATALTFLIPLFTVVAAALVLRERVDAGRWLATLAGLAGALIIIRPGFGVFSPLILLTVVSSVFYAGAWSTIKILTRRDPAILIVFYMNVLMVPLTAIPTAFLWVGPRAEDVAPLAVMALSGWAAHFCQARAFEEADVSSVIPFDFLRLPFAAAMGWFLFGETSDGWLWAGALIIFGAGYYTTLAERRKARAG